MTRVQLPDGCTGLDMPDGTRYNATAGGTVEVDTRHADTIAGSWYQQAGIMTGHQRLAVGTRRARICTTCRPSRRWNAWTQVCPRCGAPTETETTGVV